MSHTPNLHESLTEARSLGCEVERLRRTGEIRVRHPQDWTWTTIVNARRKDSPKKLLSLLRDVRLHGEPHHAPVAAPARVDERPHTEDAMQTSTNTPTKRERLHTPLELEEWIDGYIKSRRLPDRTIPGGRYWPSRCFAIIEHEHPQLLRDIVSGKKLSQGAFAQRCLVRLRNLDSRTGADVSESKALAELRSAANMGAEIRARVDKLVEAVDLKGLSSTLEWMKT